MGQSILLAVDDKAENLFLIKELVSEHLPDCHIITTQDPEEGLRIAARDEVDGAIIDVQMPGMDGVEMCRRMKDDRASAHVPVVLVTAHKSPAELRIRGLEAGADDFITKPLGTAEMVAKIRVMLRIKRAEDDLRRANAQLEDKVAERTHELAQSEERFQTALQNSDITVFTQDLDLRYTWVYNPHPALSPETVVGKTDADLIPAEEAEALSSIKRRVLEGDASEQSEIRFTAGEQSTYALSHYMMPRAA